MKKILSVLLVSIILFGCSEDRVLSDELTNKGSSRYPLKYYEGELFNGIEFDVYGNGELGKEMKVKDGKLNGDFKTWGRNGQLRQEGKYHDNKFEGLIKEWYSNGELESEINYKNGEKEGKGKEWYDNGQLNEEWSYKDGLQDGEYNYWTKSGKLFQTSNYKDGERLSNQQFLVFD
tara:strand:- start:66 stop:593 length:528 start_codon:yes stop_codon:yes gene_type:complete